MQCQQPDKYWSIILQINKNEKILDGRKVAQSLEKLTKLKVSKLLKRGIKPCLAIILIGSDESSEIYVERKRKTGIKMGILVNIYRFKESVLEEDVLDKIRKLNNDPSVHGIIVQLPLPKKFNKQKIIESINFQKDVDGFPPINWGKLAYQTKGIIPATASAVMNILHYYQIPIKGREVVIVGKSEIVGKPLSILLLNENATLSIVHKATANLKDHTLRADILVSATGCPKLIKKDMVKNQAVIIDVGIKRYQGKIVGDVDFEKVISRVSFITPVPGGVGPVTVATLIKNTVETAEHLSR